MSPSQAPPSPPRAPHGRQGAPSPGTSPLEALLRRVAGDLRTGGWPAVPRSFAALVDALVPRAPELPEGFLPALLAAREAEDALAVADLLDGCLAPALGLVGSLPCPAPRPALAALASVPGTRRTCSRLDTDAELRLQERFLEHLGGDRDGVTVALLGATGTPLAHRLADRPSATPLVVWDPRRSDRESPSAPRTVLRVDDHGRHGPERPRADVVWLHPTLVGEERHRAEIVRARLRRPRTSTGPGTGRTRPTSGPERVVLLTRTTPFHLEAPLAATLRQLSHPVAVAPVRGDERDAELADVLARERPDLVVSVNGAALALSPAVRATLEAEEIPTVLWFVDDPELALGEALGLAAPHVLALAWEREAVARLRRLGFAGARYLPHGARWSGDPLPPRGDGLDLLWIGSSYAGADRRALHAGAPNRVDEAWERIAARARSLPRPSLRALREALAPGAGADGRFAQLRLADHLAAERRSAVARALIPLGLRLFGDPDGWRSLLGSRAPVLGDVDATVVPHLVGGARLSVDCVHPQMPTAVTQRVFDVPACGGLVLADDRPDLREHFEVGREVLAYGDPEEAAERARWALGRPDLRRRIAAAARRRVEAEHTLVHRARSLVGLGRVHFGMRQPRR